MICKWKRVVGLQDWSPVGVLRQPAQKGGHGVRMKQDRWGTGLAVTLAGSYWGLTLSVTSVKLPSCSVRRNLRLKMLMGCCLTLCEVSDMGSSPQLQRQVVGKREDLHGLIASFSSTLSHSLWLRLTVCTSTDCKLGFCQSAVYSVTPLCLTPCRPWTVALQAPLSMAFSRQDTGVGSHVLLQGMFPTQGSNPSLLHLLHWQADSLPLSHLESPSLSKELPFDGYLL